MNDEKLKETIEDLQKQLEAARYVFHQVVRTKYMMKSGGEGKADYDKAMRNYDSIVANAPSGTTRKANNEEMAKGFHLSDKEREHFEALKK